MNSATTSKSAALLHAVRRKILVCFDGSDEARLAGADFFTFSYLRELLLIEHQLALASAPAFADRS